MRLFTYCKNCREDIYFNVMARDGFVLAKKRGTQIHLNCDNCGTRKQNHANEIDAVENKGLRLTALIILIGGTIGIFIYLWQLFFRSSNVYEISGLVGILTIPFLIYHAIITSDMSRIKYFKRKHYGYKVDITLANINIMTKQKLLTILFLLFAVFCYAQTPSWINKQNREKNYPKEKYITGYSEYRNNNKETQEVFVERLKNYAQTELIQRVKA